MTKPTQPQQRIINGTIKWAKVLGEAPEDTFKWRGRTITTKFWSFDLYASEKDIAELKAIGIDDKTIRTDKEGKTFIQFKKNAIRSPNQGGGPAKPIAVVGPDGKPWPQDKKIGNGSEVNVKYVINEKVDEDTGEKSFRLGIMALQVWQHVEFSGASGFPTREVGPEGEQTW